MVFHSIGAVSRVLEVFAWDKGEENKRFIPVKWTNQDGSNKQMQICLRPTPLKKRRIGDLRRTNLVSSAELVHHPLVLLLKPSKEALYEIVLSAAMRVLRLPALAFLLPRLLVRVRSK
jgi:hypothetical protein